MPNWCNNNLKVAHNTPESKEKFNSYLKENGFSFEKIVPVIRPEFDDNGWATVGAQSEAWSTKWDLNEDEQKSSANDLIEEGEVNFDTAWSPPLNVIVKLGELFPDSEFTLNYFEPGMMFAGTFEVAAGSYGDNAAESDEEINRIGSEFFGYEPFEDADEECELLEDSEKKD